ncbi:hypothetical protein [Flavobacterium sp. GP15]|uniref:hypothetical protein n=1 Tax=Flavobacterium sp. GP15 TaxID=2758567 RepID=UPI00165D814B|nr:hypothetical protein [Flavobacterium sp. GP15]
MEKERLFELIRKEEILLFAGAGFSMYAGYPSGKDLSKTMHANLTPSQQNEIQLTSDLLQVTEDIYNIKNSNKNYLIEVLKKEFQKEPSSIKTHQLLAKIPQIKTVITNFAEAVKNDLPDKQIFKEMGAGNVNVNELFEQLISAFNI